MAVIIPAKSFCFFTHIIKKAIPKAFSKEKVDRIEDEGLHPLRINPLTINRHVNTVKC